MKQTLKKMVVWLVLLLMMATIFASCNNSDSDNHTYNSSSSEKETTSSTKGDLSSTEESSSSTEESTSNTELHRHSFGEWGVVKDTTCVADGQQERSCSCGEKEIQIIAAKGHSYQAVVTKPTPTEKGYTTYTCACGDSYISDYVDPVPPELPYIVVSNSMGSVGKTVEITIALENNPGLASMKLKVAFDDTALTLYSVIYNDAMGGMSQQPQTMQNPTTLNWFNGAANSNGDFVYATLIFTVNETAVAGTYEIMVTYDADDIYNIDYDNIDFGVINGKITVS